LPAPAKAGVPGIHRAACSGASGELDTGDKPLYDNGEGDQVILVTSAIISGLCLGSMYGLIALGFHITYVVSNTVNFSQGSSVMLGAVLGYAFATRLGWPLPLAFAASLLACAAFGLLVERSLVRPFVARGSNAWLMATVAGGIVLDNAVLFTFGKEPRGFPALLTTTPIKIFGAGVFPLQLVIPLVGVGIAVGLSLLLRRTRQGKALLAVVQNPDAARLMGINVKAAIAASFALSTALAGLAGLLIAPLFSVHSDMGTLFGIKAFAVAILGGIGSAAGVMLAGLLYGTSEALITALFGSVYTQIAMFTAVIGALALMPQGLLGRAAIKKV
jgi:branched-chain amino acid transport system permease protein